MSFFRPVRWLCVAACWALMTNAVPAHAADADGGAQTYRAHLAQLQKVLAACRKARTASACNDSLIGSDDQVMWAGTVRAIRYDWLRSLLNEAAAKTNQPAATANLHPALRGHDEEPLDWQLNLAATRLSADLKQAESPPAAANGYAPARAVLNSILAEAMYKDVEQTTARERFLDWLQDELNRLLGILTGFGARSPWIGTVIKLLFLVGICVGLAWTLVRIERRSRIRLVADPERTVAVAAAREWQLWLRDARQMTEQGVWREAIHFLYWAVVARLEQRRAWAPDGARTPREYVQLLPRGDARREPLAALTRSFEHTWYGGGDAAARDYETALRLAEELEVR